MATIGSTKSEPVINFLYFLLLMDLNGRILSRVKSGNQSISWPIKINSENLNTEYTVDLRIAEPFGFSKGGPHVRCSHGRCTILPWMNMVAPPAVFNNR